MTEHMWNWDDSNVPEPEWCARCNGRGHNEMACDELDEDEYDEDTYSDEWGGMNMLERTEFVGLAIENGNVTEAIDFIMRSGDVRVDSVKLALNVTAYLCTHQHRSVDTIVNKLIRNITTWETRQ